MYGNSRFITSAQDGVHERLRDVVLRHREAEWRKPIAAYSQQAVDQALEAYRHWGAAAPLILDAGCGVGQSSVALARQFPDAFVLGVDQSLDRLGRGKGVTALPENVCFIRADLGDFWRLLGAAGVTLARHYLLYPNPWPKIGQLQRRWHAHPAFPAVLALGGVFECRSNWRIYVEELALAVEWLTGHRAPVEPLAVDAPLTPFERKYRDSGQDLFRFHVELGGAAQPCRGCLEIV